MWNLLQDYAGSLCPCLFMRSHGSAKKGLSSAVPSAVAMATPTGFSSCVALKNVRLTYSTVSAMRAAGPVQPRLRHGEVSCCFNSLQPAAAKATFTKQPWCNAQSLMVYCTFTCSHVPLTLHNCCNIAQLPTNQKSSSWFSCFHFDDFTGLEQFLKRYLFWHTDSTSKCKYSPTSLFPYNSNLCWKLGSFSTNPRPLTFLNHSII